MGRCGGPAALLRLLTPAVARRGDVSYNNVSSRIHNPGAGGKTFAVNPPRTPEIDKMAMSENSILFHRFYAGSAVRPLPLACPPSPIVPLPLYLNLS
jgi:hypothetical protein